MIIEGLSIGDELLDGRVADTNAVQIDRALVSRGYRVSRRAVLPDVPAVIAEAVKAVAARADLCLVTGGLGPTSDDVTAEALAAAAGVPLDERPEAVADLQSKLGGRPWTSGRRKQAQVPQGATLWLNPVGTAPGFVVEIGRCRVAVLPGVPREVTGFLATYLDQLAPPSKRAASETLRFALVGESTLADAMAPHATPALQVGYRALGPETELTLRGGPDEVAAAAQALRDRFPDALLPVGHNLAQATLAAARARGVTLATAESCTGGLVGGALTAVAGSSDVFHGGVIAYANAVKVGALGVPSQTLVAHGAVSEAVATAMAKGARAATGADAAVAITGVAGPGGGTPDKPVGTVWFGWSGPGFGDTELHHISGDRGRVRRYAVAHALDGLRRRLTRP